MHRPSSLDRHSPPQGARQLKKHTDAKARADKAKLEQQEKKERKSQRDAKVRAPSSVVTDPVQHKELKKRLDASRIGNHPTMRYGTLVSRR